MAYRRGLWWPLALIVLGVVLLLRNLGYVPAALDQWWPVILIALGLWVLTARREPRGLPESLGRVAPRGRPASAGGFVLIGLGLALLATNYVGSRSTGALIMIGLGLAFLVSRVW
jgi:hypothetical protein